MGLLNNLLGNFLSGQNSDAGIGSALLGLLAQESGRGGAGASADPSDTQPPAAISGGLSELVQRFQQSGLGDVMQSWIGSGQNQGISLDQLHQAIGPQTMNRLSEQTGMSHSQLLPLLAQALPMIVDRLTPNQRVPNPSEVEDMRSNETVEV